jgi:hypothetical protein
MKSAFVSVLVLSAAATTAAFAQDGAGHGPPKIVSVVYQAQSTTAAHSEKLTNLFKPKSVLASLTK